MKTCYRIPIHLAVFYLCAVFLQFLAVKTAFPGWFNMTGMCFILAAVYCTVCNFRCFSGRGRFVFSFREIVSIFLAMLLLSNAGRNIYFWIEDLLPAAFLAEDSSVYSVWEFIFRSYSTLGCAVTVGLWYFVVKKVFFRKADESVLVSKEKTFDGELAAVK